MSFVYFLSFTFFLSFFFFNDTATTEIYTLSLHDALPICLGRPRARGRDGGVRPAPAGKRHRLPEAGTDRTRLGRWPHPPAGEPARLVRLHGQCRRARRLRDRKSVV